MIIEIVTIEDTSGPTNLVGRVDFFNNRWICTMIVPTLVVEEIWGSTLLVDEGKTVTTIDGLGIMIISILAVEEMGGSRLLESEVDNYRYFLSGIGRHSVIMQSLYSKDTRVTKCRPITLIIL